MTQPADYEGNESTYDICDPSFTNVAISSTVPSASTSNDKMVSFTGCYSPVSLAAGDNQVLFLGGDNTLYWPSTDVTVKSCRAYFVLNAIGAGAPGNILLGDITGDAQTTLADVTALVNLLLSSSHEAGNAAADVNEDGSVNLADVTTLVNYLHDNYTRPIRVRFVDGNGELLYEGGGSVAR